MLPSLKDNTFETAMLSKVVRPEEIEQWVVKLREQNLSIVTLNGSFDLMHAGHLEIIYQAHLQGDRLLVALNTDHSIEQYKGPKRPLISLPFRLQMMAALEMVDYVTWFDETDPRALLARIKPDVHVNGAEYTEQCIEADTVREAGGRLHLVPRIPGLATSEIISKIVSSCA